MCRGLLWTALRAGRFAAVALILLAIPGFHAAAQDTVAVNQVHINEVLQSLGRGRSISRVAISPDGKRLAWVEAGAIQVAPYDHLDRIETVTAAGGADDRCSQDRFTWSPDSSALAFFSDCEFPGQPNLYLSHLDGKAARRLTELHGYVDAPVFSPDGSRIAFLYVEDATRPPGGLAAQTLPAGVIGVERNEIQRVAQITIPSKNWNGEEAPTSNLALGSRANSRIPLFNFLTPPNLHVYEFDWSPDSKSLAYVAADPPGENNWWVAKLYTQYLYASSDPAVLVANPQQSPFPEPKAILSPAEISGPLHGLQIAVPRWSPDGKSIAFIGGLMSDQSVTGGDVWIVSANGGAPHNLTPQRSSTPVWIEWDGNGHLYVDEIAGGACRLFRLDINFDPKGGDLNKPDVSANAGGTAFTFPGTVGDGRFDLSLSATTDRSLFVFAASTFDRGSEIYADRPGDVPRSASKEESGDITQLSHLNDGVKPAWGKSVSVAWTSDSFHVQGWLTLPRDYDPSKQYPLIVEVHGGPAAVILSHWGTGGALSVAAFSALGYFVLQPNPRGSFGQGEEFTEANRKDFGYGDLRDILAGVDAVLAKYSVDPGRVGLTGWSYGGFMTMFAVTQTNRFKAAVAGAGISDWLSYYGENSIDQWMLPYFGASVYDDPAVYAKSSAIHFIKQAHTPALIVVGDRDGECPAPQSFEFWHALRDLYVPAQLVVYPNEGHGFVDPAHNRDVLERAAEWFARYMPEGQSSNSQSAAP
jgi:dipeptidyl aminopeptidase/acylaminoacyl peptidase